MTSRAVRASVALLATFFGFPLSGLADTITLSPRVFPVGKWADGLVFARNSLWVSEGGQRTIAQLDTNNKVIRRITVGRLPTKMTFASDGAIYTAVETDNLIWQQFPDQQRGRAISGLNGCPTGVASDQHVWVLSQCSGRTHVIRLDPRGGRHTASRMLTGGGVDIMASQGQVWVAHFEKANGLSVIDEQTMAVRTPSIQGSFRALTASGSTVYAAGLVSDSGQEVVMSINPKTLQEMRRQIVDQRILLMADDDRHVIAVGQGGRIWVFSASNLELQRVINVRTGNFDPRAILLLGDDLYLANNEQQQGGNGAILVFTGWRPADMPARAPAPAAAQGMPGSAQGMPGGSSAAPSPGPAAAAVPAPGPAATACPYQVVNAPPSGAVWLYEDPDASARKMVAVPPDAKGLVADRCLQNWCHVTFRGATGWVERNNIQPTCN
jgi:hypothetical protein